MFAAILSRGSSGHDDPAEFVMAVRTYILWNHCSVASYALLVYDYFLTLNDEIHLVWLSPPREGRRAPCITYILFFLARYLLLAQALLFCCVLARSTPTHPYSSPSTIALYSWFMVIIIASSQAILILRTCGIWNNNRTVQCLFGSTFTLSFGFAIWTQIHNLSGGRVDYPSDRGNWGYLGVVVNEILIVALTLWRGILDNNLLSSSLKNGEFIRTLYRDGFQFAACILVFSIINLSLVTTGSSAFLTNLSQVAHGLLSTRVILHLRRSAHAQRPRIPRSPSSIELPSWTSPAGPRFFTLV
jgi:hypothetical protein